MGMPTPKKPNGLPAPLITKIDTTTIMIAAGMVMNVVMTVITITMTATPDVMIV